MKDSSSGSRGPGSKTGRWTTREDQKRRAKKHGRRRDKETVREQTKGDK
jgi:hypothetical protein